MDTINTIAQKYNLMVMEDAVQGILSTYKGKGSGWNLYREGLQNLSPAGKIELPYIPAECAHNAHMFYIKARDLEERTRLINYLKENNILAVFHYIPLDASSAGKRFGRFYGEDRYTTRKVKDCCACRCIMA